MRLIRPVAALAALLIGLIGPLNAEADGIGFLPNTTLPDGNPGYLMQNISTPGVNLLLGLSRPIPAPPLNSVSHNN